VNFGVAFIYAVYLQLIYGFLRQWYGVALAGWKK